MRIKKSLILFVLTLSFFIYFPGRSLAAGPTIINQYQINTPTIWTKDGSPYIIKRALSIYAPITIEAGVVIKLDKKTGGEIRFYDELNARGTEQKRIIFTSFRDDSFGGDTDGDGGANKPQPGDWNLIQLSGGTKSKILEYATVLYGSRPNIIEGAVQIGADSAIVRSCEIKYSGYIGIYIVDARPTVEKNLISENNTGIVVSNFTTSKVAVVSGNSIVNNRLGASGKSSWSLLYNLDARNNWWGDKAGPYYVKNGYYRVEADNPDSKGDKVSDGVLFRPWLEKDPIKIRKPVILVPGIGASINPDLMLSGVFPEKWTLFSHTYDGIIDAFKSRDYIEGQDFFIGYYDWRQKNADSAENFLKPVIDKAKTASGASKVNIIAHSMGGIVARSYIQSDDYANDVENLIMIGTPNRGSSDVYPVWEGGYVPKNWDASGKFLMNAYLNYMAIKEHAFSKYETVHQYIPSVKELMPVYDYINSKENPELIKDYSSMAEVNNFLKNLNSGIAELNNRVKVNVISGNGQPTVNKIPVIEFDDSTIWKDGKPDPLDPQKDDSSGDGRVLLSSSEIPIGNKYVLNYDHGDIVSQAEKIVAEKLSESLPDFFYSPQINDEMGFWFASPVDVEIKAPDNKIITSDNITQIPLAKYAGESKPDGFKIFSIPNPIKGDYEIKITGNGDGEYHIGSEFADYTGNKTDYSSIVEGTIRQGEEKEYKVSYDPDNSQAPVGDIKLKDETPPVISITSPENKNYLNDQILNFDYTITDDISGVDESKTKKFLDGQEAESLSVDLALLNLGEHAFRITAQDKAGNQGEKEIKFTIITSIDAIINNINNHDWITDLKIKDKLLHQLEIIKQLQSLVPKNSNAVNAQISIVLKDVQKYSNSIDKQAQELLINSLNYIKSAS